MTYYDSVFSERKMVYRGAVRDLYSASALALFGTPSFPVRVRLEFRGSHSRRRGEGVLKAGYGDLNAQAGSFAFKCDSICSPLSAG